MEAMRSRLEIKTRFFDLWNIGSLAMKHKDEAMENVDRVVRENSVYAFWMVTGKHQIGTHRVSYWHLFSFFAFFSFWTQFVFSVRRFLNATYKPY